MLRYQRRVRGALPSLYQGCYRGAAGRAGVMAARADGAVPFSAAEELRLARLLPHRPHARPDRSHADQHRSARPSRERAGADAATLTLNPSEIRWAPLAWRQAPP